MNKITVETLDWASVKVPMELGVVSELKYLELLESGKLYYKAIEE